MNCNLVTKLKIQCFNSLFYCRAADLFKQIFLCLISTVNMYAAVFMQEAEAAAGGSFFTVQAPTALWMWEKTTFFCPLLSIQTGTKGTAAQVRSYSTLPRSYPVEGTWARWQCAHSTLLPPELGWAQGSRAESTPGTEHFPETKSWSCESKDFFSKDTLGRRGAQPMGWCWGWGLRALPGPALQWCSYLKVNKGCRGLATSLWLVPPAKWQHRALYWFILLLTTVLGSWTQHKVCRELSELQFFQQILRLLCV